MNRTYQTLRLILGDQLNSQHSWLNSVDEGVLYVLMEIRPESLYVTHHIQKIIGIFGAMRQFASELKAQGHPVVYVEIDAAENQHSFENNLNQLIAQYQVTKFEYQLPDEYRLDALLKEYTQTLSIGYAAVDSEHFFTKREDLTTFFQHKKTIVMENFYRSMRRKHHILMDKDKPTGGKWNYDQANRKKLPKKHAMATPFLFEHDVTAIYEAVKAAELPYIGTIDSSYFIWPLNRQEALVLLNDFIDRLLPTFGLYQDAMHSDYWSLYHSRLSFALNVKMLHPLEIVQAAETAYRQSDRIDIAQAEGFIRQILGWREFIRGIYWKEMPHYQTLNMLKAKRPLPAYFWTGRTKMHCMRQSIQQSLSYSYAHHIQRLMITGNFCLLTGINPSEVDQWYLGIYIDAFEWVELPNTRGMSQYADGGIVATKPYGASANYIDKMSNYCQSCYYHKKEKYGERSCPFNSLYWHFLKRHQSNFIKNPRMSMIYRVWNKYAQEDQQLILEQASKYLNNLEQL